MSQPHNENYNEQPMTRMGRIQQPSRRYRRLRHPTFTAAIWTANNPLLQRGEIGGETDTHRIKIGDGVTYWNDLPYASDSVATWGAITGNITDQTDLIAKFGEYVKTDGTSIMSGPIKFVAGSYSGAIAGGLGDGIEVYKINSNGVIQSEIASLTLTNGFLPGTTNTINIGSSALKWKDLFVSRVVTQALNNGGNILVPSGKSGTLACLEDVYDKISNCILEIPQDINLTLSNGTLTLKAGSKVYKPDGTSYTLTADKTATETANDTRLYFYNGSYIEKFPVSQCYSGTTAPSGQTYMFWFDTTNNVVKKTSDGGSTWESGWSLPFAICTATSSAISSIDQVFNGFGYIGKTRFFLPGVKVAAPDGKNADGTVKSELYTQPNVSVYTWSSGNTPQYSTLGSASDNYQPYYEQTTQPTVSCLWYNPDTNLLLRSTDNGATWVQRKAVVVTKQNLSSGKITLQTVLKQPFRAVDYSDIKYMAHQAMPSNLYSNLTLPASGSSITAPADGYLTVSKGATAAAQYINFISGSNGMNCNSIAPAATTLRLYMPVSQGDVITINYDADGTTNMFRFIYANGAK